MQSYITKPKSVRRKEIVGREWSFSVSGYSKIPLTSKMEKLENLLSNVVKGEDMEQKDFTKFTTKAQDFNYNFSSHIFKIELKNEINKFYLFAILKSQYGKDACDLEIPKAGIMRRGGKRFLNLSIPLPTPKNNQNPQAVQDLVSILVQNIIDKEDQIKAKNAEIDSLIETELYSNQKKSSFVYSMPKISEIRKEGRLDTGLYTEEFKKIDNIIKSYGVE